MFSKQEIVVPNFSIAICKTSKIGLPGISTVLLIFFYSQIFVEAEENRKA